jgi:putative resolvase
MLPSGLSLIGVGVVTGRAVKPRSWKIGNTLQTLLKTQGRELVIVNEAEEGRDDLMQDFVAITTSFCARLYGRRRASRKKTQVLAALEAN